VHWMPALCQYTLCKADHPILRILCYNGSLVTWTVVSSTTAKFKPLIFSVWLRLVLQCEHVHSHAFVWLLFVACTILLYNRTVTCRSLFVTWRVLGWMVGFIETLYTPFGTTGNYSAISDLYTLQFTFHTYYGSQSSLVVSWKRIYNCLTVTSDPTWNLLFIV
jgi:hypothetical protein